MRGLIYFKWEQGDLYLICDWEETFFRGFACTRFWLSQAIRQRGFAPFSRYLKPFNQVRFSLQSSFEELAIGFDAVGCG